jgi:hypothetical protein
MKIHAADCEHSGNLCWKIFVLLLLVPVLVLAQTGLREPDTAGLRATTPGVTYAYYIGGNSGLDFTNLAAVDSGVVLNFDISVAKQEDGWSIVYIGYLEVDQDGQYTFILNSDDYSEIDIGEQFITKTNYHTGDQSGTIGLKAGKHAVTVKFFENYGGQHLNVQYSGPGVTKQLIPNSKLFQIGGAVRINSAFKHSRYDRGTTNAEPLMSSEVHSYSILGRSLQLTLAGGYHAPGVMIFQYNTSGAIHLIHHLIH